MKIHKFSVEQALASLNTSLAGLTTIEARRRLTEFGPNHVEEVEREHLLLGFAREFTHFFAIILWIGATLAFVAEHFDPGQGMASLGVAIVGVIVINGIFSFWQEYKAEQAVAALRQLLPQKVEALRDGVVVELLASELVPGDVVLLEEGNFVPADCRLIESFALRVNTATVTGESKPQARNTETSREDAMLYARNVALAGTSVVSGQARAVVYATGSHTEFGRIAHLTQTAGSASSTRNCPSLPHRRNVGLVHGRGTVLRRLGHGFADLGEPAIFDWHHRRQCTRGASADGNAVVGHGYAAHGPA